MAKKYFKKQKKVKKGANLPPGKERLKGLAKDVVPTFRMPMYTDKDGIDVIDKDVVDGVNRDTANTKRISNICNANIADPTVLARNVILKEKQMIRSGETPPEE